MSIRKFSEIKLLFLPVMVCFATAAPCFAADDNDTQFWTAVTLSVDLERGWKVQAQEEFRLAETGGELVYRHTDIGFVYSGLAEWLDFGFNYRHINSKSSSGRWKDENRPHLNLTFKAKYCDISRGKRETDEWPRGAQRISA